MSLAGARTTSKICIAHSCALGTRGCAFSPRDRMPPPAILEAAGLFKSRRSIFEILACSVVGAIDYECWEDCPKRGTIRRGLRFFRTLRIELIQTEED